MYRAPIPLVNVGTAFLDHYGRVWPYPLEELCPTCGQPDSCGDCNHSELSREDTERILLGSEVYEAMKAQQDLRETPFNKEEFERVVNQTVYTHRDIYKKVVAFLTQFPGQPSTILFKKFVHLDLRAIEKKGLIEHRNELWYVKTQS